jgi:hypothetical protein
VQRRAKLAILRRCTAPTLNCIACAPIVTGYIRSWLASPGATGSRRPLGSLALPVTPSANGCAVTSPASPRPYRNTAAVPNTARIRLRRGWRARSSNSAAKPASAPSACNTSLPCPAATTPSLESSASINWDGPAKRSLRPSGYSGRSNATGSFSANCPPTPSIYRIFPTTGGP